MKPALVDRVNIQSVQLSQLRRWAQNPRRISDEARSGLRASIERFGLVEPVVVNRIGKKIEVVSGHQRLGLLLEAGVKQARCVCLELPAAEARALALSLNNRAIQGEFTPLVIELCAELRKTLGPDAYASLALECLRGQAVAREAAGRTAPDDIPEPPRKAVTRSGDLWTLGDHRLLCGNSRNAEDLERLMDGERAGLLSTDPPYLVDYTGADRPQGAGRKATGKDWSQHFREQEIKDPEAFVREFLTAALEHVEQRVAIYIWHGFSRLSMIERICVELKLHIHQVIIWAKPVSVFGRSYYPWRHEQCILAWREGKQAPLDRRPARAATTVWELGLDRSGEPSPEQYSDVWPLDWDGKKRPAGIFHPTVKPVEVFARPMRVHTAPGEICLEPFCGSGSQLIAAERLSRRCYAMEIEPVFVDVAVRRWEEFTGRKAERSRK